MRKLIAFLIVAICCCQEYFYLHSLIRRSASDLELAWGGSLVSSVVFFILSRRGLFLGVYLVRRGWPVVPRAILHVWLAFSLLLSVLYLLDGLNSIGYYHLAGGFLLSGYIFLAALSLIFGRGFAGAWVDRNLF